MSLKDIDKLRERVEKDPNSKLFVPLAEEYRKEGMLDDAVSVLIRGLEKQPGYMSARVSLGKIYLEKGMPAEARAEFENVVRSIPDNLYAQKKLAEIYRDNGQTDMAIRSYRTVLKLNVMDEEALSSLRELEGAEEKAPSPEVAQAADESLPEVHSFEEETALAEESELEEVAVAEPLDLGASREPEDEYENPAIAETEEIAEPAPVKAGDELLAFESSLFGAAETGGEKPLEEVEIESEETLEVLEEQAGGAAEEFTFADINEALKDESAEAFEVAEELPAETMEGLDFSESADFGEDVSIVSDAAFAGAATERKVPSVDEAERQIADGNYAGAMNVYRTILSSTPEDRRVLQRIEELKALLKLLGKDKETLVIRLNALLEGVQKRRDEFFRST